MAMKRGRGRPPTARAEIERIIRESWSERHRAPTRHEIIEVRDGSPYSDRTRKVILALLRTAVLVEDGGRVYLVRALPPGAVPELVEAGG